MLECAQINRSTICRLERDLENISFLSVADCVNVGYEILNMKLGGVLKRDLGYNECVMLISSSRHDIRLAWLLLMSVYYATGRKNFTHLLFKELYEKTTDDIEKILLLNIRSAIAANCELPQTAIGQAIPRAFSQNTEILNRLLIGSQVDWQKLFANQSLPTATFNTMCQVLRPRVKTEDQAYIFLIEPLLNRIIAAFETHEELHFGIPNPWFICNALKLLRSFLPTRYIRNLERSTNAGDGAPYLDSQFIGNRQQMGRLHRASSLLINFAARRSTNAMSLSSALQSHYDPNHLTTKVTITSLLDQALDHIFSFVSTKTFSKLHQRHYQNLSAMIRAEACRVIFSLQPSDQWVERATGETLAQFHSPNASVTRNAIASLEVAARDPSLIQSQPRILSEVLERLSSENLRGPLKARIAQLLVRFAMQDIALNGLPSLQDDDDSDENTMIANQCYNANFLNAGVRRYPAPCSSPHVIINSLLLMLRGRDTIETKTQIVQCACDLISLCKSLDAETFVPVAFELMEIAPTSWKPLTFITENESAARRAMNVGQDMICEEVWINPKVPTSEGSLK